MYQMKSYDWNKGTGRGQERVQRHEGKWCQRDIWAKIFSVVGATEVSALCHSATFFFLIFRAVSIPLFLCSTNFLGSGASHFLCNNFDASHLVHPSKCFPCKSLINGSELLRTATSPIICELKYCFSLLCC